MSSNSSQAYCLRRNNHPSDMIEDFEKMLKEEHMVDVTLSCDEGTIRAHKLVLSASSSYFRNVFSKLTHPFQYPVVIIKDMPFSDLKAIVDFIYRGEVTVPQEQLPSILKSAEALKVKGLAEVNSTRSSCQDGTESGSPARKRRKKRRKISRSETTSNAQQGNSDEDVIASRRDSSEDNSEYSDEDDEVSNSRETDITPVSRRNDVRTFNETNNAVEGDIEPARLLEQSMITGDAQENGNTVPRFPTSVNISNVQPISTMSSQDVKPMMFDENTGLLPQLSTSLPQNEPNTLQTPNSQNHLPPVSVPCTLSAFDATALSSIPGPSTISQVVSRPSQSAQEQFVLGSSHASHPQASHPQATHLLTPQMHPSLGCHALTSMSVESLSGRRHYQCPVCLKSFSEKGNMKRHTQIHLQQRNRYMCDLCSKCFAWKDNFNRHRRIAHCDHNVK